MTDTLGPDVSTDLCYQVGLLCAQSATPSFAAIWRHAASPGQHEAQHVCRKGANMSCAQALGQNPRAPRKQGPRLRARRGQTPQIPSENPEPDPADTTYGTVASKGVGGNAHAPRTIQQRTRCDGLSRRQGGRKAHRMLTIPPPGCAHRHNSSKGDAARPNPSSWAGASPPNPCDNQDKVQSAWALSEEGPLAKR